MVTFMFSRLERKATLESTKLWHKQNTGKKLNFNDDGVLRPKTKRPAVTVQE